MQTRRHGARLIFAVVITACAWGERWRCCGGEPAGFPLGTIVDRVACTADETQTYALYLPSSFDPGRPAPVIFCFEPGARGRLPVERFQPGAERFGYIIASSNNSRNGPFEPQRVAVNAMFSDVFARFAVDRDRIVLAGMSGGARLATRVAEQTGLASAVIACGAGFSRRQVPPAKVEFRFIGIVGVDDFNYNELRRVDAALTDAEARHRLIIYAGGHEWPPPEVATVALESLELDAMRGGTRERDMDIIERFWASRIAAAEALAPADRLVEWRGIVADFRGLVDVTPVETKLDAVVRSQEGRALLRAEREEARQQEDALAELSALARNGSYRAVRKLAETWRKTAEQATDTSARRVARRVIGDAVAYGREGGQEAMAQQLYADAVPLLELCVAFRPERAAVFVDLARAYAGVENRKRALECLKQAAEKGYADAAQIAGFPEFDALRANAAFQTTLAAMRKNGGS